MGGRRNLGTLTLASKIHPEVTFAILSLVVLVPLLSDNARVLSYSTQQ
jgi:hypothetical protein